MKKAVGLTGLTLGTLALSLELFALKIIQSLEMVHGEWYPNVWRYGLQPPCMIALLLTVAVILFSLVTCLRRQKAP